MRTILRFSAIILLLSYICPAQSDRDFSGFWKLNPARSEIHNLPTAPNPFLKVGQKGGVIDVTASSQEGGPFAVWTFSLDGKETKGRAGDASTSTMTKWEGDALLVNTLVSGPQSYTVTERWRRSRDGATLTIRRTIVRISGESESLLIYENPALMAARVVKEPDRSQSTPAPALKRPQAETQTADEYVVDSGTRILLSLVSSVNTKSAVPGDRVYLETAYPILSKGRVVIPRGSFVMGTVTEAQRPGRVKGKPSLQLRFDSLTLPNGVVRDFRSRPGSVDGQGDVSRAEGKLKGEGNKGGDARTVGETTAAGTSVGAIAGSAAGHAGMGAGIGAAAGAAAGLIGVLASRGPELILRKGSTMEMVLDRTLRFTATELR
jgi:hypothetical protein